MRRAAPKRSETTKLTKATNRLLFLGELGDLGGDSLVFRLRRESKKSNLGLGMNLKPPSLGPTSARILAGNKLG